jgi:hypothetical protein
MSETALKTCGECGAALAADQRYCLNCGRRRGEPRIDFRSHPPAAPGTPRNGDVSGAVPEQPSAEAPEPPPGTAQAAGPSEPARPQRDYAPLAAAGGIAVLGLMLLVGVLIGRGSGEEATAPPPQIVRVPSGGEEASGGEEEGTAEPGQGGSLEPKKDKGSANAGAVAGGTGKAPPPEITADDSELEALEGKTGKDYSEAAAELPDEIATPGQAPPTDNKAPGAGSKGATIE